MLVNQARFEVERVWMHGNRAIFKFLGIDSISAAEPLAGFDVCIPAEERATLPEGEYYLSDLIGCEVIHHQTEQTVGVVSGWQEHGGPPLLEVKRTNGRELLIPFAKSICIAIDPLLRRVEVDMPEGLDTL